MCFLHSGLLSNFALALKECALNSLYWICIFYHSGFLSNFRLPWKQSLPWKFPSRGGGCRLVRLCVRLTTPRGVTWLDGARGKKFGAPVFEPDVFRKQMYSTEENTCDIVGTFRRLPQWFGTRGNVPPYTPSLRPWPHLNFGNNS